MEKAPLSAGLYYSEHSRLDILGQTEPEASLPLILKTDADQWIPSI